MNEMDMDVKFMQMAMSMLESIIKTKNMGKELFFGLVCVKILPRRREKIKLNNMRVVGGEDCQMAKDSMKDKMVFK